MSAIIPILELISAVIEIFIWMLIVSAILSWLTAFGVINRYNRVVATIGDTLYRLTDPVLRPIRNILPTFGGIDLSPGVVIILIQIVILPMLVRLQFAITNGAWQPLVL